MIGTKEYSKVLNRGGFGVTGLEVAEGKKKKDTAFKEQKQAVFEMCSSLVF